MSKRNAALREIVGGQFQRDPVARQHADAVASQAPCEVRKHDAVMIELHAEQPAGEFLQYNSGDFNIVFLAQSNSLLV